jgi:hypothetical protein
MPQGPPGTDRNPAARIEREESARGGYVIGKITEVKSEH